MEERLILHSGLVTRPIDVASLERRSINEPKLADRSCGAFSVFVQRKKEEISFEGSWGNRRAEYDCVS